ncbi:hypothetical protein T01_9428 [Trichinella spiralis]|uniref:Uncharacterized protein n=1 Tax=Trichinella spiralis TaxID=6334 RepID=A0A0V1AZH0_TRISP|nr:hypothetical protein T01_9428 [Trichinella spiralis]
MLDAVRSSWGLESRPSRRTVSGEIKVRWFFFVFQRHPLASVDRFFVGIALSAAGTSLAHLYRWNPPDAINSSRWAASVLALLSDSQDVAKSSTYMLCSTSAAARGAETRCRHTCTLTVLLARKRGQVSHSFG